MMTIRRPQRDLHPVRNGARLAPFALAAYPGDGPARTAVRQWADGHLMSFVEWRHGNAAGVLLHNNRMAIIAIAGTDDADDWAHNRDAWTTTIGQFARNYGYTITDATTRGVQIHRGFAAHAANVLDELREVSPDLTELETVWIVGHSLGGVVAQLIPYVWRGRAHVVTYGCPRWLWHDSSERALPPSTAHESVTQFCDIADPVPTLPRFFYRHPDQGARLYLRHNGDLDDARRWPGWLVRLWHLLTAWRGPASAEAEAHSMTRYVRKLEARA